MALCRVHDQLPESGETVMTDMREIGPTYYFAPPRILRKPAARKVMIRMEDASAIKRGLFRYFTEAARRCGPRSLTTDRSLAERVRTSSAICWSTDRSATCSA
jgi:long-chain acyl-CoA synthetase